MNPAIFDDGEVEEQRPKMTSTLEIAAKLEEMATKVHSKEFPDAMIPRIPEHLNE